MSASVKSTVKILLRGVAWLLFAIAGLTFWFGGRAISEFAKTERMLAEMEGFGLAMMCGGLGVIVKTAADRLEVDEVEGASMSESKSLRK
jgi:hypothetical protein